jgi:hypothetical protein
MPAKSYSADTFWNLDKPLLPRRSQLHPLKPIGIRTLYAESLTGYIARLAQYHCLTTEELLLYEVLPLMRYRGCQIDSQTLCRLFGSRKSLTQENETRGELVKDLLQSLEELTGRQDLFQLSLLRWASEIFAFSLLHPYQAWCPICYQEWRNDNRIIYTPLLWLLVSSDVCIRHPHQVLLDQCPYCQLRFLALTEQSCPGYCSKCHQWLGHLRQAESSRDPVCDEWQSIVDDFLDHGLHWQYWWVDSIEQVVANTPASFLPPKQSPCPDLNHLSQAVKA